MTIYALSSGPGISGVAVVRVSGKETTEVVKKLTGEELPSPRVATLKKFNKIDTNELIDEGVIIWFPGPNSYTGEDLAEFHVHGSRAVISALHSSISKIKNCRLAEPGEFTKIAFQNGKINLLKAESIADLVSSETEIQRKQAIKIMSGKSSDQFNSWREKLLKILSHVEAKIDFPEEDLPKDILSEIQKTSDQVSSEIEKIIDDLNIYKKRDDLRLIFINFQHFFKLFIKKNSKIGVYLPMQKSLKILPKISSTSTFPTIIPRCLVANLKSSAALSNSSLPFLFLKFFK